MKGVMRQTASKYETGDILQIFPDDYIFAGKDLANGRVEVVLGNLTDAEISKLEMSDDGLVTYSAINQLPTFRSKMSGSAGLRILRRRKYQFDNGVKLKANAQERT